MEDQLDQIIHIIVLCICSLGCIAGDGSQSQSSCNVSPFVDKRSHATFLGNTKAFVNGDCLEETEISPRPMCLQHTSDRVELLQTSSAQVSQVHSTILKQDDKEIKSTEHPKNGSKRQTGNKKLKGSKKQRKKKKKKKKKIAKKKRKS